MSTIKVTFEPGDICAFGNENMTIADLAREVGINIYKPCGGKGTCGKCKVQVENIKAEPSDSELKLLSKEELSKNIRLACQTKVSDEMVIKILSENDSKKTKILSDETNFENIYKNPLIKSCNLKINLKDEKWNNKSLSALVSEKIGKTNLKVNADAVRDIANLYNPYRNEFAITVFFTDEEIIAVRSFEEKRQFGVGVDIGTTSVVSYLVDMTENKQIAISSKLNAQVEYGDDVISRINYINQNKGGLEKLQSAIVNLINEQISELCSDAKIDREQIFEVVINGNTIMQHIFLGVNPKSIGMSPYIPSFQTFDRIKAKDLGIDIAKFGIVTSLPNISGYVGSDALSGAYLVDMANSDKLKVVIDIGTNNEIIMGNKDFMFACASAAGPAFEGARISSGMRGTVGAVEKVRYKDGRADIAVIGDVVPVGICGSGIIDLMSELLRIGIVDETGKITDDEKNPYSERVERDDVVKFRVTDFNSSEDIYMTQKDIREIQLAKGAVLAGLIVMLKEAGLTVSDIDTIYLAGAFGNYINKKCAINIGLLPDIDAKKVETIGNSSAKTASRAVLSEDIRKNMEELSKNVKYIELSTHPDFQGEFLKAVNFPKEIRYEEV